MNEGKLSFRQHLNELRRRLVYSVLFLVIATAVAFAFHQEILRFLMEPAEGFAGIPNQKPIYTELTEFIGIAFKVSLVTGFVVSLPFTLFQIVMFVTPGLTKGERRYLYVLLPVSVLVFIAGAAFGYRVLFPPAVRFLLGFSGDVAEPLIQHRQLRQPYDDAAVLDGADLRDAGGDVLPVQDRRRDAVDAVEEPPVRHRRGVRPGGDDHADHRPCQPGPRRATRHRHVRGRHLAREARSARPSSRRASARNGKPGRLGLEINKWGNAVSVSGGGVSVTAMRLL